MMKSLMSSFGMNERPTSAFNGKVARNTRIETPITMRGCASDHSSERAYQASMAWKILLSLLALSDSASLARRNFELSIGVSVKLTSIDTMIEKVMVQPNGLMNRRV